MVCFPDSDGIATKTRTFYAVNGVDISYAIDGRFRGSNVDNTSDIFIVEISTRYLPPGGDPDITFGDWTSRVINLPVGCDITGFRSNAIGYKQLHIGDNIEYDCLRPMGIARVHGNNNDSITIKYTVQQAPGSDYFDIREEKIFKGIRVQ